MCQNINGGISYTNHRCYINVIHRKMRREWKQISADNCRDVISRGYSCIFHEDLYTRCFCRLLGDVVVSIVNGNTIGEDVSPQLPLLLVNKVNLLSMKDNRGIAGSDGGRQREYSRNPQYNNGPRFARRALILI